MTKSCDIHYNPDADCPYFEEYILDLMDGDEDVVRYLQKYYGQALLGYVKGECLIQHGKGGNGKSVITSTMFKILGDYAVPLSPKAFDGDSNSNVDSQLAKLKGARLCIVNEVGDKVKKLNTAFIRELLDSDEITAKKLYQNSFSFQPTANLVLNLNPKPIITDTHDGTWRRIRLLHFNKIIAKKDQMKNFAGRVLMKEAEGIFNWLVEGCTAFLNEGEIIPARIELATNNLRDELDTVQNFLDELLDKRSGALIDLKTVYDYYNEWSKERNYHPLGYRKFKDELLNKDIQVEMYHRQNHVFGYEFNNIIQHTDSFGNKKVVHKHMTVEPEVKTEEPTVEGVTIQ